MTSEIQSNILQSTITNQDTKLDQDNTDKSKFQNTPQTAIKSDDQYPDQIVINMEERYNQLKQQQQKQKQFNEIRDKFDQQIEQKQNEIYLLGRQIFELSYKKSEEVPTLKKKLVEANIEHHQLLKDKHNELLKNKYFSSGESEKEMSNSKPSKFQFKHQINLSDNASSLKKFNYLETRENLIKSDQYDIKYPLSHVRFETEMKLIDLHADSLKIEATNQIKEEDDQQLSKQGLEQKQGSKQDQQSEKALN